MDLFRIFRQKKIKNYCVVFLCTYFLGTCANEQLCISADLPQENLEQVNDRLKRLENKVEDIDECYVRVKDIQKDVEMIKRSMKESAAVKESEPVVSKRLETRLDKLEETVQDLSGRAALMDTAEEIRKVTEYVCPNGHGFETMSEDGKCRICGLNLKEREHFKKFKFARRESISERISTALEEEFKKRILVGASGTGIFQQILNDGEGRHSSAEGSLDLLFIGKPLTYMTFFVDLEAIGGNGPDEFIGSISGMNEDSAPHSFQDSDGVDRVSVREAWLQTELMKKPKRLVAGA